MTLIVEDGTGKTDAESYADVAFADAWIALQGAVPVLWSGISTDLKEAALRKATQYLDDEFGQRWRGYRKTQNQALRWPRDGAYDRDGYLLSSTAIPLKLKQATAAVALEVALGKVLFASAATTESVSSKDLQVGSLRIAKSFAGGASAQPSIPIAAALIQDLIEARGLPVRA